MLTQLGKWVTNQMVSSAIGISIFTEAEDNLEAAIVIISKSKKGDLAIESKVIFEKLQEACDWVLTNHSDLPVLVLLDGKSVLTRIIPEDQFTAPITKASILDLLIPGAKLVEFYVNAIKSELGDITAVSRTENIQNQLAILANSGINVFDVFVGPPTYFRLYDHFKKHDESLDHLGCYTIQSDDTTHQISRSENRAEDTLKSDFQLQQKHFAAFGAGMSYFLPIAESDFLEDVVAEKKSEFWNSQLYSVFIWLLPGLVFVLLAINAGVFVYSSSELQQLKESSSDKVLLIETFDRVKREYNSKSVVFENLSPNSAFYSYCADQIGSIVTDGLLLDRVSIHPSLQQRQNQIFETGVVLISGLSQQPEQFGKFIDNLERLDWVDEIDSQSYQLDSKTNHGYFQIRLLLSDEMD